MAQNYNPEADFEKRRQTGDGRTAEVHDLRTHRESKDLTGSRELVAHTLTGEQVTINPTKAFSVTEISRVIRAGLEKCSQRRKGEQLEKLREDMGLNKGDAGAVEAEADVSAADQVEHLIIKLAEDIVDAMGGEKQRTIAVLEPSAIGEKTTSKLGAVGDANFLVNEKEGESLLQSLRQQDSPFEVHQKNQYGFVLRNRALDFRVTVVYQNQLDAPPQIASRDLADRESTHGNSQITPGKTPNQTTPPLAKAA
ncbi:MAG: hypothetical protein HYV33_06540 [Candidatus Kerfeldbacteria bacterium]|nr:hypothetical protein [Candidatus Kerfeldbacteria bacterium]